MPDAAYIERDGTIATIILNRPEQLPGQLADLLLDGLHASATTNQKLARGGDDRPFAADGAAADSGPESAGSATADGAEISPG